MHLGRLLCGSFLWLGHSTIRSLFLQRNTISISGKEKEMRIPLDKAIEKIVALGVPGLVLVIVIAKTGLAGGAAIVAALATLGGPWGMMGGLALLGVLVLISQAIAKYGVEIVAKGVTRGLVEKRMSKEEIIKKIDSYWFLSDPLKRQIKDVVEDCFRNGDDEDGAVVPLA